jgi:dTDP-glucose pyrophosphorylase
MNIIIPMAGKSTRFFSAGYTDFKYKLKAGNKSLFSHSLESFKDYFLNATFYFGYIGEYVDSNFLTKEVSSLGITNYQLIDLGEDTSGQAETVHKILKEVIDDSPIIIFNIDTKLSFFRFEDKFQDLDGYVEVFKGHGDHWSFIKLDKNNNIIEVAEKKRISDLCSNGLYVFKNKNIYNNVYNLFYREGVLVNNETFIMPMYNYLIKGNRKIEYKLVDINSHDFFGTPNEYEDFKTKIEI